jgi:hypothetical protein
MDKNWDGKFSNLKISKLAFPELYQELKDLQHKERSDRLRSLAMLGLYSLQYMSHNKISSAALKGEVEPAELSASDINNEVDKTKSELKDRLLRSVGR